MKKLMIVGFILVLAVSSAFAAKSTFNVPILPQPCDSSSSPDNYGYTWVDNHNGGSPVFNWIDITTIGTQVVGLVDDNVVGPFSLGFDFPFYWYEVSSTNIGANGFISFTSMQSYSQDFAPIPSTSAPNDMIVPLACDLDFGTIPGGACYYYTNNADSFIVSWINVPEWRENPVSGTEHTFQLILCATDSSITFQYGPQVGDWQNPDGATSIGIEDLFGRIGINYLSNLQPPSHVPTNGMVVRIHPEPDPAFEYKDIAMDGAMNPTSGAIFCPVNQPMTPLVYVKNGGTIDVDDIPINCKMKMAPNPNPVYNQTITIEHLDAGESMTLEFPLDYTPDQVGVHTIVFKSNLQEDDFYWNNADTIEMRSYQFDPDFEFTYADTAYQPSSWAGGDGGFANEFIAPEMIEITEIGVFMWDDNTPCYIYIMPADEYGNPNEASILFGDTTAINDSAWAYVDVPERVTFNKDEKFFIAALSGGEGWAIGQDTGYPLSHRGWENVGSYTPSRDRGTVDIAIKFTAQPTTGIADNDPRPISFGLNQNYPNPFNATTEITFNTESNGNVVLDVYNIAGQKIKTLVNDQFNAGSHRVIWNGSNDNGDIVSSGVYFYKMSFNSKTETKKMVLVK
jgi:hypothetical protein